MDKGALPVRSVHLYCNSRSFVLRLNRLHMIQVILILSFLSLECQTNYHHNFRVKDGIRTYYDGIPAVIQVGEHQFAEKRLVQLWISLMLISWQVLILRNLVFLHLNSMLQDLSYQLCTLIQSLSL
jgi:hypothetical protein